MKKILLVVAALIAAQVVAFAGTPFSINVSSYPVTESAFIGAEISGTIDISNITFSNSSTTAQTIVIYKLGASTTTASAIATFVIPAAAGFYRPFGDQNYNDRITVTDVCFRKSSAATTVYATGIYQ